MGFSLFGKKKKPDGMLPEGWQFYSRPSNLEPPGTVFRIDGERRRFIVARLDPQIDSGAEPGVSKTESVETRIGVFAGLIGLQAWNASIGESKARVLQYEITEPVRASTTDAAIDLVLQPFISATNFRPENRYYVIREVRSASAMKYILSNEILGELGGKANVTAVVGAGVNFTQKDANVHELTQQFPERLGVMYLAEEIAPDRAGLAASATTYGRVRVRTALDYAQTIDERVSV